MDESFDNVIVVDGVPIIDKSKYDKLVTKISKEFTKKGATTSFNQIILPWNDAQDKSKG